MLMTVEDASHKPPVHKSSEDSLEGDEGRDSRKEAGLTNEKRQVLPSSSFATNNDCLNRPKNLSFRKYEQCVCKRWSRLRVPVSRSSAPLRLRGITFAWYT